MKIYPGKHSIYNVDSVDTSEDIALGYLDSEFIEETISIRVNDDLDEASKIEVYPYNTFDTLEVTLYDENENALTVQNQNDTMTRQESGKYMYMPKASLTFDPITFKYRILAKKNMEYSSYNKYNLKVACGDMDLAKEMIQLFADSYQNERKMCPTNIKFNNGDMKTESLIQSSIEDNDFVFIRSSDGEHMDMVKSEIDLDDEDENDDSTKLEPVKIDLDDYFSKNVVPWIICDQLPGEKVPNYTDNESRTFNIKKNSAVNTSPYETVFYFDLPKPSGEIEYHDIFGDFKKKTPIVIKEYVNKGFVVYCNSKFMNNVVTLSDIFYDTMMYVYFNSYIKTKEITEWIADTMPDYVMQNGRCVKLDKFTSHMELHKILGLKEGDASVISIDITQPGGGETIVVSYKGMTEKYIVFEKEKNTEYADPIKGDDQKSIFTERKNIVYYSGSVYKVKERIADKISCKLDGDELTVYVKPFKNTDLNTREFLITANDTIKIDSSLTLQEVNLVWNNKLRGIQLVDSIDEDKQVLLAVIQVHREKKGSKLYDMRKRGGGTIEDDENFNCLDVGHILGRPYRKGGAMITTIDLPKKYEYRKDELYEIIYNSIKQYMVADDYLILELQFI